MLKGTSECDVAVPQGKEGLDKAVYREETKLDSDSQRTHCRIVLDVFHWDHRLFHWYIHRCDYGSLCQGRLAVGKVLVEWLFTECTLKLILSMVKETGESEGFEMIERTKRCV